MNRPIVYVLLIGLFVLTVLFRCQVLGLRAKLDAAAQQALQSHANEIAAATVSSQQLAKAETRARDAEQVAAEQYARIRQLEATLQARDAFILSLQAAATNRTAETARTARRPQTWFEDFGNPRQYAAIEGRRDQARREIQTSLAEKADFFRARDMSDLSDEELAGTERLIKLLDDSEQLTVQLRGDLPPDERRALLQKLFQNTRELEPLLAFERSKVWYELGMQLGYTDDDTLAVVDYLNTIVDLTSMQAILGSIRAGTFGDLPAAPNAPPVSAP
ncbi:MAG: hypothetical protein HY343_03110 [Lentisphaerae bacterium]|nr:hypothetical protein [Lentisphaerota bacterium]